MNSPKYIMISREIVEIALDECLTGFYEKSSKYTETEEVSLYHV